LRYSKINTPGNVFIDKKPGWCIPASGLAEAIIENRNKKSNKREAGYKESR